ncbi:hypothetical protein FB565_000301 [Actinoplanes lutulentus]|uniref:Sulfotransferase family protein n=1 Tax=Actinoplanes lutulentus TaxID=1287878 RepID=A0A327ZQ32_9ACTN|nr:sulfotransferase family protein [Actinoplanes lutulentus]MBB2940597.1 hypothetical protein [Actinoplanes lutulentus]RAK42908.1 hypothetical protein B0I29_10138 [Actinoplanes lutulentus]
MTAVFLWAHPRSLSTAFLRMMLERGDFLVVHEPLSSIVVQGYAIVDGEKVGTPAELLDLIEQLSAVQQVFVKETTEYLYDVVADPRLPRLATHSFIIRHPARAIASHYAMNPLLTCHEIGYRHQLEIFDLLRRGAAGPLPVIEAERLLDDPHRTVRAYCRAVGIPFLPQALTWQPSERREWSRTAPWHRDAARSTGFRAPDRHYAQTVDNNPVLADFYRYHLPFYERLRAHSLGGRHAEPL